MQIQFAPLQLMRSLLKSQFAFAAKKTKPKTLYQILELPSSASMAEIKKNYLRLAKIYHPDVYKGKDSGRFEKINEAYKTLSDKGKRNQYDQQIGIKRMSEEDMGGSFKSGGEDQKGKNKMDYEGEGMEEVDLDEEYKKFFDQKSKTKFEQIRLAEDPQFRSMSEGERLRRHFTNIYQADEALHKAKYQKQFTTIMDDQIDQKNRRVEDTLKDSKDYEKRNSPEGIKKLKWKVYFLFITFCMVTFPIMNSILTRYRLQTQEKQKLMKQWEQINSEVQQMEVRSRFKY